MWIMAMWMMAMPHRMMPMNIAPGVVFWYAWFGEQLLRLLERLVLERLVLTDEDGPRALRDELARRDVVTEGGQRWRRRQRGGHVPLYCCASARRQQHRQAFLLDLTLRGKTHVGRRGLNRSRSDCGYHSHLREGRTRERSVR